MPGPGDQVWGIMGPDHRGTWGGAWVSTENKSYRISSMSHAV
jgi:hypothetical protein